MFLDMLNVVFIGLIQSRRVLKASHNQFGGSQPKLPPGTAICLPVPRGRFGGTHQFATKEIFRSCHRGSASLRGLSCNAGTQRDQGIPPSPGPPTLLASSLRSSARRATPTTHFSHAKPLPSVPEGAFFWCRARRETFEKTH